MPFNECHKTKNNLFSIIVSVSEFLPDSRPIRESARKECSGLSTLATVSFFLHSGVEGTKAVTAMPKYCEIQHVDLYLLCHTYDHERETTYHVAAD